MISIVFFIIIGSNVEPSTMADINILIDSLEQSTEEHDQMVDIVITEKEVIYT